MGGNGRNYGGEHFSLEYLRPAKKFDLPRLAYAPDWNTGCWMWRGNRDSSGYGRRWWRGKLYLAHRVFFDQLVRPLAPDEHVDHLCRTRACVNPLHMEAVTPHENWRRGNAPTAIHARKTHCKHGHEFTEANTIRRTNYLGNPRRGCKACSHRRPLKDSP